MEEERKEVQRGGVWINDMTPKSSVQLPSLKLKKKVQIDQKTHKKTNLTPFFLSELTLTRVICSFFII